ncbi:4-carboxy-4-hydroxy-2-oxoadipate aldolase/oxaloacetate decarboxylase [Prauserella flavalba]|uniref:4-carboxy-4-hydroxy-2-oxoadipate aldolase/oxaloacetate decarboxylase n=1 Tax=Prauserella flavalba TaxID=1477506 RepID=UPI0036EF4258
MSTRPSLPTIFTDVDRRAGRLSDEFVELGVATVHESQGRSGLMDPAVRPVVDGTRAAGTAVTCLNQPGDNLMLLAAIELCAPGDVLVVGNLAPVSVGMVGEIIVSMLRARGVAGLVVDSGVRDVRELRRIGLPVWSRCISAAGTIKAGPGWVNVPLDVAGATVHPGDLIVADDDGVVVVPMNEVDDVLARGRERLRRESALLERIQRGDVPGLPTELVERLASLGVRRVSGTTEAS